MVSRSCDQCATTKCIQTSSGSSSSKSSHSSGGGGTNAGAIAGGVIGGLVFVTVVVGLIWWFFIRKKRNEYSLGNGGGSPVPATAAGGAGPGQEKRSGSIAQQARKSTHSIASTVLTRASNVIQIAYIPGVTNRSPPDTPSSLVPPVPPLPGAAPDQHFFMPGDLRDSSFTEMTNDRRSGAPSISPSLRSSVATTAYRSNAIISPVPAQQATRTRAAVVSIHGNQQPATQTAVITPPDAPAVPAITSAQLAKAGVTDANANASSSSSNNNNSSIVGRSMMAKPVMVKMLGGNKNKKNKNNSNENSNVTPVQPIEEQAESSAPMSLNTGVHEQGEFTSGFDDSSDDEPDSPGAQSVKIVKRSDTAKTSGSKSPIARSISTAEQGPFTDQNSTTPPPRVQSPFSDANEVK